MELGVRRLRDDLVDDLVVRMTTDPVGDHLAEKLALLGLRRRENLHTRQVDHSPIFLSCLHSCHGTLLALGRATLWTQPGFQSTGTIPVWVNSGLVVRFGL